MDIDWAKVKFRASSWGNLMAEPQTKADREAGNLGATCKKELVKIYAQVMYGRKKDIVTKQMEKGTLCEPESIKLYSMVEGRLFYKNDEQIENEWFTGHPDIYIGDNIYNAEQVDDIKSSWEIDSFLPKLVENIDKSYEAQLNCYYSITGAKYGHLVYCLVDCPIGILEDEKRKLLMNMDVISEFAPEYLEAADQLERLLTFPDIDFRERVIKIPVPRNEELIQKMKDKVPILRNWLAEFHEKHMNLYPKH